MTVRRWLALLAAGLMLAACTSSGSSDAGKRQQGSAGQYPAGLAAVLAGLHHRVTKHHPVYYLSLGDSLAQGVQPGPDGVDAPTTQGYPDQLESMLHADIPEIRLVKLGCSGETTSTMIYGGICSYPAGSQLAQAIHFLRGHRGRVALVTIDIGANDPNTCVLGQPVSQIFSCLSSRIAKTERNVVKIMTRLRAAAGNRVLIVGMTYYVPELGLWRRGQTGRELAMLTEGFAAGANQLLVARYHRYGAKVANVFDAFKSADFAGISSKALNRTTVPPNVRAVCSLTWMCAPRPLGPNEHANDAGYRVIAKTFWRAIIR
jgi:lysophospholipase L1-like esterase